MDSVSFGDIWDVSLSCRRGLFYMRLYPGGRVQNSSVKMWLLYIQTAFGKLCLYEFIKPDLSFQSGCVTACQVSAEDDGAYYDRQKKLDEHFNIHTGIPWFAFSDRSKRKCFRLKMQCLLKSIGSSLPPLSPGMAWTGSYTPWPGRGEGTGIEMHGGGQGTPLSAQTSHPGPMEGTRWEQPFPKSSWSVPDLGHAYLCIWTYSTAVRKPITTL